MQRRRFLAAAIGTLRAVRAAGVPKILVYTRSYTPDGKGYVHQNIAASVQAIRELGNENGFSADASDDPAVFTRANLKQYRAIVFSNSNNEAFSDDAQREAFKHYIQSGGGFAGIHSASGSERKWPYFWSVIGGKFVRHPKLQTFTVRVKDSTHPATRSLPAEFVWEDECYYLDNLNPAIRPLLVTDPARIEDPKKSEYPGGRFGDSLPLAWFQTFDGGRQFYTALGHKIEHYADPLFRGHLAGGIDWVIGAR